MSIGNITSNGMNLNENGKIMQIGVYEKQITKLNHNWRELEEFVKNKMLYAFKNEIGYYKEVLDKMKEIKKK